MPITDIRVERFSLVSSAPFEEIVASLDASVGHPDVHAFRQSLTTANSDADLQDAVNRASGTSGLIEFYRFDAGAIMRKELGGDGPRILRLLIGNPVIMRAMAKAAPDAAAYAPVTVLIDERQDGVHLSYDLMASLLAPYGSASASSVALDLDIKITKLLEQCASPRQRGSPMGPRS